MDLEQRIANILKEEAEKLIKRYHEYHNAVHSEYVRNTKRLGNNIPVKDIRNLIIGLLIKNLILFMLEESIKVLLNLLQNELRIEPIDRIHHI